MNADTPFPIADWITSRTRQFARDRSATFAATLLLVIAIPCLLAPLVAPYDPSAQPDIIGLQSVAPSLQHPFGTDPFSRDVLSRVIYGGRLSLTVALFATLVSVTLGTCTARLRVTAMESERRFLNEFWMPFCQFRVCCC
jgi:ABC-type dipeptide/oligopeptide/nickel transport systems, permease components